MSQVTRTIREALIIGIFAIGGWFLLSGGMVYSQVVPEVPEDDQDAWDECLFEGHPDIGDCDPNREHFWEGDCQGVDCYTDLEPCCQM